MYVCKNCVEKIGGDQVKELLIFSFTLFATCKCCGATLPCYLLSGQARHLEVFMPAEEEKIPEDLPVLPAHDVHLRYY